jgi:hypothetical protein
VTKLLLALHVIAAIVAIGPVTVAASMFPPAVRRALAAPDDPDAVATPRLLYRICQVYAFVGVAVPVFGLATAGQMGVLGSPWLIVSIALTVLAAVVLGALVLPQQGALTARLGTPVGTRSEKGVGVAVQSAAPSAAASGAVTVAPADATVRLAMYTGVFNLLWAVVTVLMIVRPGSTTGA